MEIYAIKLIEEFVEKHFGICGKIERTLGGLSNENYFFRSPKGLFVIKIYAQNTAIERLKNEEIALAILSKQSRLATPMLITATEGDVRLKLGRKILSCFSYLEGECIYAITRSPTSLTILEGMGSFLAILHEELNPRDKTHLLLSDISPYGIVEQASNNIFATLKKNLSETAILEISDNALKAITKLASTKKQLIHGDFQPGNLLFRDSKIIGVCDFEYCCLDYRIVEIALCIGNLISGGFRKDHTAAVQAFLAGYENHSDTKFSASECDALNPLIDFSWLLNLTWVYQRLNQIPDHPELLTYLQQTIEAFSDRFPNLEFRREIPTKC